jgi:predicted tellurium resistance membrane protein TerC
LISLQYNQTFFFFIEIEIEKVNEDISTEADHEADDSRYEKARFRTSLIMTAVYVAAAVVFGFIVMYFKGRQAGFEFFAGYLVEQSLSVDNLFVFLMLFNYFQVPLDHQGRVLTWGIVGAVVMRGFMIICGVAAVRKFKYVILIFAGILLVSAVKLFFENDDAEDLSENLVMKLSKRLVGAVDEVSLNKTHFSHFVLFLFDLPNFFFFNSFFARTKKKKCTQKNKYDGDRFFTKVDGVTRATPLLLCLVCIELSDFVFAVDSIPAVIGVSQDLLVVYSSNIFAILGLRSLYTLVAKAVSDLPYLRPAVALVLAFIGLKMILEFFDIHIPIGLSLLIVVSLLVGGILLSIYKNNKKNAKGYAKIDDKEKGYLVRK